MGGARVIWKSGLSFEGKADSGFSLPLDTSLASGGGTGFSPMELLLVGLAGCTGMDVISILKKKQQDVTGLEVAVHGERADSEPRVYTHITVEYIVTGRKIDPAAVERAIQLSETKYCSVEAMLDKTASIEHKITLQETLETN
ncbi:predicted redox protein, regulator of disulfide bond formation [Longilinea arvoryzae]|uniref:Predicted redox protein, regulator of disulfide bond formation n=1 Tax=Longilinea arvoryzae TaxID=360412 RepID=A0A0S7BGH3_9CHLR|nr:OsmC family protein [Longilinea arvoryzae]GAP14132.1 predicted redox protein, regulator of disulfide bond formation [Longilinea arvoryzae]